MANLTSANRYHNEERSNFYADTRTHFQRFLDSILEPETMWFYLTIAVAVTWAYPLLTPISLIFIVCVGLYTVLSKKNKSLPFKLPLSSLKGVTDPHEHVIGSDHKKKKAAGDVYLGNERGTGKEIWMAGHDFLTHMDVKGATGAGKSYTLFSICASTSLIKGGGVMYTDLKGGLNLLYQFAGGARRVGREDDVRAIVYRKGGRSDFEKNWDKFSNTNNPFAIGGHPLIKQVIEGMMAKPKGDNQTFIDRAVNALNNLLPCLVELRDQGLILLSASTVSQFINMQKLCEIAFPEYFMNEQGVPIITYRPFGALRDRQIENKVSLRNRELLKKFITGISDFKEEQSKINPYNQPSDVNKQFSYAESYLAKPLAELAANNGHIYEHELGEVDYSDIVLQNKILITMVPALESSESDRTAQGAITLSGARAAIATGLGSRNQGKTIDTLKSLPVDKQIPSVSVVDEFPEAGEAASADYATILTQSRSMGIGSIISSQDIAGMMRAGESAADMIFGNTMIKLIGALGDTNKTLEQIQRFAGKVLVSESANFDRNPETGGTYKELKSTLKEVEAVSQQDLMEQTEGQFLILNRGKRVWAQMYDAKIADDAIADFRFNTLLNIRPPSSARMKRLKSLQRTQFELRQKINEKREAENSDVTLFKDVNYAETDWIQKLITGGSNVPVAAEPINNDLPQQVDESSSDTDKSSSKSIPATHATTPSVNMNVSAKDALNTQESVTQPSFSIGGNANVDTEKEHKKDTSDGDKQLSFLDSVENVLDGKDYNWIRSYKSDDSPRNEIISDMANIFKALDIDEDSSNVMAAKAIDDLASQYNYTSNTITKEENDEALFDKSMDALKSLNEFLEV